MMSRTIPLLYRYILPIVVVFLLLIISPNLKRPLFLDSLGIDIFARIWIIFGYCSVYLRLSDLDRYMLKLYSIEINNQLDNESPTNWRNIILGSILGIISVPITQWVIQFFLPIFSDIGILLALLHGFLLSAPVVIRRKKLVL